MADKRQIVMYSAPRWSYSSLLMHEWLIALTGKTRPKVCLLSTPQGDADLEFSTFYKGIHPRAEVTWAPMFNALPDDQDPEENILSANLIYIPGGYAQATVAAWRAAGWDMALRQAWEQGAVIAGNCAGAMSFCRTYANRWLQRPGVSEGLGFLDVSLTVHADHTLYESVGSLFRHAIRDRLIGPGYQIQDGFALRFAGSDLAECVTSRSRATGWYIEPADEDEPQILEHELYAESLRDRLRLDAESDDQHAATAAALNPKARRALLRRRLDPKRRPLDGPFAITSSIESPSIESQAPIPQPALEANTPDA